MGSTVAAKAKTQKSKAPKDEVIEGKVIETTEQTAFAPQTAPKANAAIMPIITMLMAFIALGVAVYQGIAAHNKSRDFEVRFNAVSDQQGQIERPLAALQAAVSSLQNTVQTQQDQSQSLAKAIDGLSAPDKIVTQSHSALLIGLLIHHDMRQGRDITAFAPFVSALSDKKAQTQLHSIMSRWQAADYPALVATGRSFITSDAMPTIDMQDAKNSEDGSIVSGIGAWFAGLIKLEPLEPRREQGDTMAPKQTSQPTQTNRAAHYVLLADIEQATAHLDSDAILMWREQVAGLRALEDELSSWIVNWLTKEAALP